MWQLSQITPSKLALGVLSVGGLTELLYLLYKNYFSKNNTEVIHKVIFFGNDRNLNCSHHLRERNFDCMVPNCTVKQLNEIRDLIRSAKFSLDVCVYFITYSDLAKDLISACKNNIKVRIICDSSMCKENDLQLQRMIAEGLKIRSGEANKQNLMHHKFLIIDGSILLTGSVNWTYSAFFQNRENLIITNAFDLVWPFQQEFEKLWRLWDVFSGWSSILSDRITLLQFILVTCGWRVGDVQWGLAEKKIERCNYTEQNKQKQDLAAVDLDANYSFFNSNLRVGRLAN